LRVAVVSALYIYPVKSCRGIQVSAWRVAERGFVADRRWMIVDGAGRFVTQRERAELALVHSLISGDALQLSAPGLSPLSLPLAHEAGELCAVSVWRDQAMAAIHEPGSAWFSAYLGAPHSLVYMPESQRRQVNPERARLGDIVSFADGYPFLLISEASLADLNSRLDTPLAMQRFRPNIVVSGCEPYAEDGYARVRLGEISFRGVKRCERCVITCIDPETAERGREPLRTLAQYRLEEQKVWFGMNLIHDGPGLLRVGDSVEIVAPEQPRPV
jgi:uncharacterized protein YcbX